MKHISQAISFLYLILIFNASYGESLPIENYDEIIKKLSLISNYSSRSGKLMQIEK